MEWPHQCHHCDRIFKYESSLLDHMNSHTGEKPYHCSKCDAAFLYNIQLKAHMKSHGEHYKCSFCPRTYFLKSSLEKHVNKTHTREQTYKCSQCENSFLTNNSCDCHLRSKQSKEILHQCPECDKFIGDKSIKRHVERHKRETPFSCRSCDLAFPTISAKYRHEGYCTEAKLKHYGKWKRYFLNNVEGMEVKINNNTTKLNSLDEIKEEVEEYGRNENGSNDNLTKIDCDMKNNEMKNVLQTYLGMGNEISSNINRINTAEHIKVTWNNNLIALKNMPEIMQNNINNKTETDKWYVLCRYCDKTFKDVRSLNNHMKSHNGEMPFQCRFCGEGFSFKIYLSAHLKNEKQRSLCKETFQKLLKNPLVSNRKYSKKYNTYSKKRDYQTGINSGIVNSHGINNLEHTASHKTEFKSHMSDLKENKSIEFLQNENKCNENAKKNNTSGCFNNLVPTNDIQEHYKKIHIGRFRMQHHCRKCNNSYSSESAFKEHMNTHTKEKK